MSRLKIPPLSIYAHMPWCVRKCPYCDFNSHVAPESIPQERYVEWLLRDLEADLPHVAGREVQSIFFGGGTPSLFAPHAIKRFLDGVQAVLPVANNVEITLEANPGTIERGRFSGYREAGVNRVSLGVQSFSDHQLKVLGRIHHSQHALDAVGELRESGFDNFNLDLMYGLPEQRLAEAVDDLKTAIQIAPTHLSHYQLTLEPGTVFFHRPPPLPDDDAIWEMQIECQSLLSASGYHQYEVSGYARESFRCRHNLNYWQFGDYLGLGAGAHGKWTDLGCTKIVRTERTRQPREYLALENATSRIVRFTAVAPDELPFEFMLNALRLNEGFAAEEFEVRTGLEIDAIACTLAQAIGKGLLAETGSMRWRPTELGRRFLSDLQSLFFFDANSSSDSGAVRAVTV
jgi:oxygen-independent coproporphyrinogen-3 oxidase